MRTHITDLWDKLRSSLWFIPTLMAAGSVLLAFVLVRAQEWISDDWMLQTRWLASGDPDGARQILATIAGSIITVTGVTFSVTIVALSLASQQFGPRLLRTFMRDRGNQYVLGTFIGVFLYSLLVLRVVQEEGDETKTIPYLAVSFGVVLAVAAMGMLIYFIHHVVSSIQADTVIANVNRELHSVMKHVFPEQRDEQRGEAEASDPEHDEGQGEPVTVAKAGYVRSLDREWLIDVAKEHEAVVHILARPGRFVIPGMVIARVHCSQQMDEEKRRDIEIRIRRNVLIGHSRTAEQDIEFPIAQLVEIAVRSLSPSLNDPFTAMTCLDRLGEALGELGLRELPKMRRCYADGRLRLLIDQPDFEGMVSLTFNQIRQNATRNPAVIIRILEVIAMVLDRLESRRECFAPLLEQARMVQRAAEKTIEEANDRNAIEERYSKVMRHSRTGVKQAISDADPAG